MDFIMIIGLPDSGQEEALAQWCGDASTKVMLGGFLMRQEREEALKSVRPEEGKVTAILLKARHEAYPDIEWPEARTVCGKYAIPRELAPFNFPDLEEGFDEIYVAEEVNGKMTRALYERRVPMTETVVDEHGQAVQRPLGRDFFFTECPGGAGGMSRAAFERLFGKIS